MTKKFSDGFYIKKYPSSGVIRYSWVLLFIIAIGGFIYPYLGLLMIPMMFVLLFMSLFRGRFWCGNVCPRGSFLEMFLKRISRNSKIPTFFSSIEFRLVVLVLFFSIFAWRLWGVSFQGNILEQIGILFASMCLITTIISIFVGIPFSPRAWCSFCPMGSLQNLLYRFRLRIFSKKANPGVVLVHNKCSKCSACSKVCPMQLKPSKRNKYNRFDGGFDCLKCGYCVNICPNNALKL